MKKTKILLADDDRVIVATMAEDLEETGYQVIPAYNGKQALEECMAEAPDLAILDVRMPVMDGLETASKLKEKTNIPFIFLTAYSDKDVVDEASKNGALGYLVKPISVERMVPVIETALARSKDLNDIADTNINLIKNMETRREIDIAMGLMMERYGLMRKEAFELLRHISRSERNKVETVASRIVEAAEILSIPQATLQKLINKRE